MTSVRCLTRFDGPSDARPGHGRDRAAGRPPIHRVHRVHRAAPLALTALLALVSAAPAGGSVKRREPGPRATGKVYEWTSSHGGAFLYHVPRSYDEDEGANLTIVLHGSNGNRFWGMANCPVGKDFRPDDIVISPDGSQRAGEHAFNRGMGPDELAYLHTTVEELREVFRIRDTFLYGHSQGAFFSYHYACTYPDEVKGVVAMAGNVWSHTPLGRESHGTAFVVLHGTADPVVPYGAGVAAFGVLREAGYPLARFRTLERWNHWPTDNNAKVAHTAQQLAWCEGMTTSDMDRLEASFERIADCRDKRHTDHAAAYTLARRIAGLAGAPEKLKRRAQGAVEAIEALARSHVDALEHAAETFEDEPWVGHLPVFLRQFRDVPAREALAARWKPILERHLQAAVPHLRAYHEAARKGDADAALGAAVQAIGKGFLHWECSDRDFLQALAKLREEARDRDVLRVYDGLVPKYQDALEDGLKDFYRHNGKASRY